MGFRFWRRIRIAPGVTLNLSKRGGSISLGPRGAKLTLGRRGTRATLGLPGTGLFYTQKLGGQRRSKGRQNRAKGSGEALAVPPESRLTLSFFKRLFTPPEKQALVDGCRALVQDHEQEALRQLEGAAHLADGACLAGLLALKLGRFEEARSLLDQALERRRQLGRSLEKLGLAITLSLPVTDEVTVHVQVGPRAVLLALAEVNQRLDQRQEALASLEQLRKLEPEDLVLRLSLAELLLEGTPRDKNSCRRVVRLAQGVANETPVHAALLLYKARALRALGMLVGARSTLTAALARKKGRSAALLHALRYERALVYQELRCRRRARSDLERIYSEAPDYQDVEARLADLSGGPPRPSRS